MNQDQVDHALNLITSESDGKHITVKTPSHTYHGYVELREPCFGILRLSSTLSTGDYFIDITHITSIEGYVSGAGQDYDPDSDSDSIPGYDPDSDD